jgi:hypothetical protein
MLSDIATVSIISASLVGVVFAYGAYWAMTIRRVLMNYVYRKQAFWAGLVAIYFVAQSIFIALALLYNQASFYVNLIAAGFIAAGFVVIFIWIDSTIIVARRSDPLQRNTLRWSGLRYFIAITTTIGLFFNLVFNVIYASPSSPSFDLLGSPPLVGFIGTLLLLGAVALLLSAKRSGDLTLRRHLKWFGLGAALLFLSGQVGSPWAKISPGSIFIPMVTYSIFAVAAYCFYRSSKSLAPLGRLTLADIADSMPPTSSIATS